MKIVRYILALLAFSALSNTSLAVDCPRIISQSPYISRALEWLGRDDLDCVLTIDREAEGWQHKVGLIPNVLLEMNPSPKN